MQRKLCLSDSISTHILNMTKHINNVSIICTLYTVHVQFKALSSCFIKFFSRTLYMYMNMYVNVLEKVASSCPDYCGVLIEECSD